MPSTAMPTSDEASDYITDVVTNPASAGNNAIGSLPAPGVGWRWLIYGYTINATGGANSVQILSGVNPKTPLMAFAANGGSNMPPNPDIALIKCNENEAVQISLSAATAVGVQLWVMKWKV